ncbi:zinc finger and BTB domain-containing 11 [Pelobates cultripes]|uniref:Zinc finger and BTB domain-containing 11 n=1 Tax=Pelobates cultripes TaxID=61616 RepID=A0AAD1TDA2_PELCU|nr:zinc finger and BTB domain-containing 11 [Pelobates cultripes]
MSSEESYLAILRYLTNEREPYAPGTEGNVKRKIRKAAACYVVQSGTLYYQRRQRDKERFTELEVVLQPERRKGLIEAAHTGAGGEHLTRHQTWHNLSQTYWWRGESTVMGSSQWGALGATAVMALGEQGISGNVVQLQLQ